MTAEMARKRAEESKIRYIVNEINEAINKGNFYIRFPKRYVDEKLKNILLDNGYHIFEDSISYKISW